MRWITSALQQVLHPLRKLGEKLARLFLIKYLGPAIKDPRIQKKKKAIYYKHLFVADIHQGISKLIRRKSPTAVKFHEGLL